MTSTASADTDAMTTQFAQLCGNLAPWASTIVFLAPIPTIQKIMHDKSVGNLPLLPYSSMIGSTFLWSTYGVLKQESRIWSANAFGLVCGVAYFYNFIRHAPKASTTLPGSIQQHMQFILAIIIGTSFVATMSSSTEMALSVIGMAGVILVLAMFASPLAVLRLVLEKKSAKAIPLPFTLASFANCFLWSVFGWFEMNDVNIWLPNGLGLLCSLVQIGLKLKFGDGKEDLPV